MATIYGEEIPRTLFKYRALSTPDERLWLEQTLLQNLAYWATPGEFNDPFDCAPVYRPLEGQELALNVRGLVKRVHPELNRPARRAREQELLRTPRAIYQDRIDGVNRMLRRTAIYSLGSEPDNVLMWSHYSRSHQGVCLAFDAEMMLRHYAELGPMGLPVSYSDDRPVIKIGIDEAPNELLRKAFLVKSRAWQYEREWRFIHYKGAAGLRRFPPKALTAVILGAAIGEQEAAFARALVAQRSTPTAIFKAVFDPEHFRINIEP